jgi:hypothetical protein
LCKECCYTAMYNNTLFIHISFYHQDI